MIVADTNVLIDYLEGRSPGAEAVSLALRQDQLQTTTLSCFELLVGIRSNRQLEKVLALLDSIPILLLDFDAARKAAELHRQLERSGITIGMGDSLIAGIVLARGGTLLTRNRRHFERVPGLPLADV
ncbi:MAG: type II toxin-antitoxin system VapC family toxin [Terriglobia bacterium]